MTWTGNAQWDDSDNTLSVFCNNTSGNTEFLAKWDDANNVLEIHADGTDYQVKWDDTGNNLEARNIADGVCTTENCCGYGSGDEFDVTFSGITDCGNQTPDCTDFNSGTYRVSHVSQCNWLYSEGTPNKAVIYTYDNEGSELVAHFEELQSGIRTATYECFYDTVAGCETTFASDRSSGDCGGFGYDGLPIEGYTGTGSTSVV